MSSFDRLMVEIPSKLSQLIQQEQRRRQDDGQDKSRCTKRAIIIEWLEAGAKLAAGERA